MSMTSDFSSDEKAAPKKQLKWEGYTKFTPFGQYVARQLLQHGIDNKIAEIFATYSSIFPWSSQYDSYTCLTQPTDRVFPLMILQPKKTKDVISAIQLCTKYQLPYAYRHCIADNKANVVLLDLRRRDTIKISGDKLELGCGVTLSKLKKKISWLLNLEGQDMEQSAVNIFLSGKLDVYGHPICNRILDATLIKGGDKVKITKDILWALKASGNPGGVLDLTIDISKNKTDKKWLYKEISPVGYCPDQKWITFRDNIFLPRQLSSAEMKCIETHLELPYAGRLFITSRDTESKESIRSSEAFAWGECSVLLEVEVGTDKIDDIVNIKRWLISLITGLTQIKDGEGNLNKQTGKAMSYTFHLNTDSQERYRYYGENADKIIELLQ